MVTRDGVLRWEVRESWTETGRWEVTVFDGGSGTLMPGTWPTEEQARQVAHELSGIFDANFREHHRLQEERYERQRVELEARSAERAVVEKEADRNRRALIEAGEGQQVTKARCPICENEADPADFDQRIYECSRCGTKQREDEGNRCTSCNIFMAKLSERSCESCNEEIEDGEELVEIEGIELDGHFYPKEES